MKKIVELCARDMMLQAQDVVKLRLRGKGSGFKEGPSKLESEEPLHLCISSKFHEKYLTACEQVELLISEVYSEYDDYCVECDEDPPMLRVKKQESISGKSPLPIERLRYLENAESLTVPEVEELINARNEARRQCNFVEADRIRNVLRMKGIALMDEKGGRGKGRDVTTWKFWKHS